MKNRESLTEIFNEMGSDKGSYFTHKNSTTNIAHNYTSTYDEIMTPFRDENINFLEIGLWSPYYPGASIKAWTKYFTKVKFYGIDIVDCRHLTNDNINISMLDQSNESELNEFIEGKPKFKFIIDDGGHTEHMIIKSLGTLFPHLESGGVYFIEDLHVVDKKNLYKLINKNFETNIISLDKIKYINENISSCYFTNNDKLCIIIKK